MHLLIKKQLFILYIINKNLNVSLKRQSFLIICINCSF